MTPLPQVKRSPPTPTTPRWQTGVLLSSGIKNSSKYLQWGGWGGWGGGGLTNPYHTALTAKYDVLIIPV